MTTNSPDDISMPVRLPAEWEAHECVLLAWPHEHTDWAYMLDEARECIASIVRAVSVHECVLLVGPASMCRESVMACGFDPSRVRFVDLHTNDTWARDFGPITVETGSGLSVIDFKFNAWGMKFAADKDNLINTRLAMQGIFKACYVNRLGFVLEGGSIESDGCGTLLTTAECLLSPNRNGEMTEGDIRSYLADTLGFSHQLWLHHGALAGDDTDSHIDTLARLAPNDTILYVGTDDVTDSHYDELNKMKLQLQSFVTASGQPYNLIELPLPDAVYDEEGNRLPATYANFLIMNHSILMPVYRQPQKDELAAQIIKIAFPDHQVVKIDCSVLIKQHGSLHCVTMQVPETILPI